MRNLVSFSTSLNSEPPAYENAARYPISETNFLCSHDRPVSSPSLKNAVVQARISCRRSNSVKIISDPSATRYTAFKVIRSNIEIAITPPQIARLRSHLVQSFITSQAIHCKCSSSKVKGQLSQRKVMYQHQKCYDTAMNRFSDFKLGMASN